VRVKVEFPLTSVAGLMDAVTPEGRSGAESVTSPKPKDFTCNGIESAPLDIL
jgi:hypothetical protein